MATGLRHLTGLCVRARVRFKRISMSLPCRLLNPTEMFSATATVSAIFVGSVWAGENRAAISSFRRQNPTAFVLSVLVASYILLSLLGSTVFLSAVVISLACKFRMSNVAE